MSIDHVSVGVTNMKRSKACYDAVLAPLGMTPVMPVEIGGQLVGVGVASEEGDSAAEEARAEARARQIAGWLTAAGPATVPVWSLNLGQYQGVCTGCDRSVTDWQRPIIIVGLVAADSGVSLGQALADALRDRSNLPDPSAYSKFALIRER